MGLDMYLYTRHKVSFSDFSIDRSFSDTHEEQIGYWRKFNALHNYIVKEFANGEDVCQEIELDEDGILQILEVLKQVTNNKTLAKELLPTGSGFFFGSLEYDKWYFEKVEYSISVFEKAFNFIKGKTLDYNKAGKGKYEYEYDSICYQASW